MDFFPSAYPSLFMQKVLLRPSVPGILLGSESENELGRHGLCMQRPRQRVAVE